MNYFGTMTTKEASLVNSLVLAYVGDAVHSLIVREQLVHQHDCKTHELHTLTSAQVNARTQAQLADSVFDLLTEDERAVFMRGRNGKSHHKAKNATVTDYHKATAFEAVIGYLYLTGNQQRILQLLGVNK